MPLPKLIEIVPFSKQQLDAFKTSKAEIVIPGSKSITNRAIVLAALGEGTVTLNGALWSEDTEAMTDCMQKLGISAVVEPDPKVAANRIITVTGCGGKIPKGGTEEAPLELFVANAGTAARFLTAMVCLGSEGQVFRLSGVPRMHERPQKELIRALRALGYRVETPNDKLPAVVYGGGAKPGPIVVSVDDSSQFASALLLSSHRGGWQVSTPEGSNPDELPYVEMTRRMVEVFPHSGGTFQIEPDASSASYFHACNTLFPTSAPVRVMACQPPKQEGGTGWQIDAEYPRLSPVAGSSTVEGAVDITDGSGRSGSGLAAANVAGAEAAAYLEKHGVEASLSQALKGCIKAQPSDPLAYIAKLLAAKVLAKKSAELISRKTDLGDSIMTAIPWPPSRRRPTASPTWACCASRCERVKALGRVAQVLGAGRRDRRYARHHTVRRQDPRPCHHSHVPRPSHGHVLRDARLGVRISRSRSRIYNRRSPFPACFPCLLSCQPAHAGRRPLTAPLHSFLLTPLTYSLFSLRPQGRGDQAGDPSCVRKAVPSFFQILAAPPPAGLGVEIWECDETTGARVRRLTEPDDLFASK